MADLAARCFVAAGLLLVSSLAAAQARHIADPEGAAPRRLSSHEVSRLLVGKTVTRSTLTVVERGGTVEIFGANGRYGHRSEDLNLAGRYWIANGQVCTDAAAEVLDRCRYVLVHGDQHFWSDDGLKPGAPLTAK